jgi:phosphoribosylformylglycinamidine cyclo-ligase
VLPADVDALIDRSTWTPAPIFDLLIQAGQVNPAEMERTFNMGVGMVALIGSDDIDAALAALAARVPAWIAGQVVAGSGRARLVSSYGS